MNTTDLAEDRERELLRRRAHLAGRLAEEVARFREACRREDAERDAAGLAAALAVRAGLAVVVVAGWLAVAGLLWG